jgi:hypothetical protein
MLLALGLLSIGGAGLWPARAGYGSDHGDTPMLIGAGRHDGRISDLYAFTRGDYLVLIVCLDPTIPPEAQQYQFASDLRVRILIDNDSEVVFDDPDDLMIFGGTITEPHRIQQDVTLRVAFDESGAPALHTSGISGPDCQQILLFTGLRDDPFIRGPRIGHNIAAIVIELPLDLVLGGQDTLLIWATSAVDDLRHEAVMGVPPDVMIYNTLWNAEFPNGRDLVDDIVDLVGDPRVLESDFPFPDENDVPFLDDFPYLAPPHPAP